MSYASSHGIIIDKPDEIYGFLEQIIPLAKERESEIAKLLYYEEESGLNVWLNLDGQNIKDYYFGFNTDLQREVLLTEYYKNYENKNNSVIVCEDPEGSEYKIAVMMNNYYLLPEYELPINAEIKIYGVAFQEIDIYKTDEEFDSEKNKTPIATRDNMAFKWGDKFLAPIGLMNEEKERFEVTDIWLIARVNGLNMKTNSVTGNKIVLARCSTVGGEIDILFPGEYKDKLSINAIIDGIFVLRGEVMKTWDASEEIKEMYRE